MAISHASYSNAECRSSCCLLFFFYKFLPRLIKDDAALALHYYGREQRVTSA